MEIRIENNELLLFSKYYWTLISFNPQPCHSIIKNCWPYFWITQYRNKLTIIFTAYHKKRDFYLLINILTFMFYWYPLLIELILALCLCNWNTSQWYCFYTKLDYNCLRGPTYIDLVKQVWVGIIRIRFSGMHGNYVTCNCQCFARGILCT